MKMLPEIAAGTAGSIRASYYHAPQKLPNGLWDFLSLHRQKLQIKTKRQIELNVSIQRLRRAKVAVVAQLGSRP